MSEPSVCIPRVFSFITKSEIIKTFENLLGKSCVERVDIVSSSKYSSSRDTATPEFNKVFVHFKYWPDNEKSQKIRKQLLDNKTIKLVYNEPWFWKCSASRLYKPVSLKLSINSSYGS
jgi:hypothetical protein